MKDIVVVLHDIRSTHNVGAILRSCDGFGIRKVLVSGYTPYPELSHDTRLPHIRQKLTKDITKTALGAEKTVSIEYSESILDAISEYKEAGFRVVALEQDSRSTPLSTYKTHSKTLLIVGREVEGLDASLLGLCDDIVEIPMHGQKESFNLSVTTAIALYQFTEH